MDKKRILICDDDESVREALNLILKDDFELSFCNNGGDCLNCLSSGQEFNLLLVDIKMPRASGLEILRKIKEKRKDLKAIVISGYSSMDCAQAAFDAGAADYIVKPFSSKEVLDSVARHIG